MKNKKIIWTALPFLAGAIFGISLLGLLSFTGQSKLQGADPAITRITVADAHTYFQNYFKKATPYTSIMKGFTIDKAGLTAMNTILGATPSAAGFRVYFGTDASGAGLWIICGVDSNGSDMTGNIYGTNTHPPSPCPPNCDLNSPISQ